MFVRSVFPRIKPFTFGDTPVFAGQSAQVACSVSEGDAPLELSWTFDGPRRDVFGGDGSGVSVMRVGDKTSLLSIDNTDSGHRGTYTCSVSNRAGNMSYSATLNVHGTARALHARDADRFFPGLLLYALPCLSLCPFCLVFTPHVNRRPFRAGAYKNLLLLVIGARP